MQTILSRSTLPSRLLHGSSANDRILSAHTETIKELRPSVADDPTLQMIASCTPSRREHKRSDEHDHRILYQANATADPVAFDAYYDLPKDDADDLEVVDCCDPVLVAD